MNRRNDVAEREVRAAHKMEVVAASHHSLRGIIGDLRSRLVNVSLSCALRLSLLVSSRALGRQFEAIFNMK